MGKYFYGDFFVSITFLDAMEKLQWRNVNKIFISSKNIKYIRVQNYYRNSQ